jgi:chondroitin AC lyase
MRVRSLVVFLIACANPLIVLRGALSSADMGLIRLRVEQEAIEEHVQADQATAKYRATMAANGSWPNDIDYSRVYVITDYWKPMDHIQRLTWFAVSYSDPAGIYYHNAGVRDDFLKALDFWLLNRPVSPNWWYNQIGVPRKLGPSLLLMETELNSSQLDSGISLLEAEGSMTGQNLVWTAGVALRRGLLERNLERVERAATAMKSVIAETPLEGIQVDGSFYQHETQIYNGGYGLSFLNDISRMIAIGEGTGIQLSTEERNVFDQYLIDGTLWMQRHGYLDVNVMGRDFTRYGATMRPNATLQESVLRVLRAGGGGRMAELESCNAQMNGREPVMAGHKHFWRGDYTVQKASGATVGLRMMSSRTVGAECGNGENLKGVFQGLGMHLIQRSGTEYQEIFPSWDWLKLPGTTLAQTPEVPSFAGYVWTSGPFAGGVSDGKAGISVLSQSPVWVHEKINGKWVKSIKGDVRARKSWFFFGDGFLVMGDGIESASGFPVFSTVNQCHLRGTVRISRTTGGETDFEPETENTLTQVQWVHHDGVGYFFPSPEDLLVSTRSRSGWWTEINSQMGNYTGLEVRHSLFTLGFNHGVNPADGRYSCVVLPDVDSAGMRAFAAENPIRILLRNQVAHVVRDERSQLTGIVFFEPATVELMPGVRLSSDQPVAVLLREMPRGLSFHVADPTQHLDSVTLGISGTYSGGGSVVALEETTTWVTVPLPKGVYAGSSVALELVRLGNHQPVLHFIGSKTIQAGQSLKIEVQAVDADAQDLDYTAVGVR